MKGQSKGLLRVVFVLAGLALLSGCTQAPSDSVSESDAPAASASPITSASAAPSDGEAAESTPTGGGPSGSSDPAVAAAWQTVSGDIQAGAPSSSSGADWFAPDFTALSSAVQERCYPDLGDVQTTQLDTLQSEFDIGAASDDPNEKMLIEAATAYLERVEQWC